MKRILFLALAFGMFAEDVLAHGGSFRGPNGSVPPGMREPGDPAPPPSDPGTPRWSNDAYLTFGSWRFWWAYNNDDILALKSPISAAETERAVLSAIIPALMRSLNRPGDHEDIHGGALVALGKIGTSRYIALFNDATNDNYKTEKGRSIKFGPQATESAVLAMGLLTKLDEGGKEAVRRVCLEAIANDKLRRRDRAWAAVAIGFQKDRAAVDELVALLDQKYKYADDNIPCGIIAGLGLIADAKVLDALIKGLTEGKLYGRDVKGKDRIRAFCGYAIGKIGDPEALPAILGILKSRSHGRVVKRSAVIAAGILAAKASDELKEEAVKIIHAYVTRKAKDPSGENFGIIALSQIGTEAALNTLLKLADSGKYGQRPFAGLGLATYVFYNRRAVAEKRGEPMNKDLEVKIVNTIRKLSDKYKDSDTKAAFMLCRGLVKDKSAIDELVKVASKKSTAPVLRGFCCVALGLIGDAREDVKDALRLALGERKSTDLRRDAATGLGLLRDAEVGKLLLRELKKAKSFAVQGQLITAIGTIGDHTAIQPLVDLLDDKGQPSQTRAMAAVGLGMIGDLRKLPALSRVSKNYNYRASVKDLDELLFIL